MSSDVCAVILTFQPDLGALDALVARVVPQVGGVVIVDNGSDVPPDLAARFPAVRTIALGENLGVAAGHNRGIRAALEEGYAYVLILDQDSLPAPGMVAELRQAFRAERGKVAAAGPRFEHRLTAEDFFFTQIDPLGIRKISCGPGDSLIRTDFLISSGCLFSASALADVGLMREELFIDHVDTDWFLRARASGWSAYGVCPATMQHAIGERTVRLWLSGRKVALHSPLRHYYAFRNGVFLCLHSGAPWGWKLSEAWRRLKMLVAFSLVPPDRLSHLRMMLRGICDGVRGRLGRFDS